MTEYSKYLTHQEELSIGSASHGHRKHLALHLTHYGDSVILSSFTRSSQDQAGYVQLPWLHRIKLRTCRLPLQILSRSEKEHTYPTRKCSLPKTRGCLLGRWLSCKIINTSQEPSSVEEFLSVNSLIHKTHSLTLHKNPVVWRNLRIHSFTKVLQVQNNRKSAFKNVAHGHGYRCGKSQRKHEALGLIAI